MISDGYRADVLGAAAVGIPSVLVPQSHPDANSLRRHAHGNPGDALKSHRRSAGADSLAIAILALRPLRSMMNQL